MAHKKHGISVIGITLAIMSIVSFGITTIDSFFLTALNEWTSAIIFIIFGLSLIIIGNITRFPSFFKDGIDSIEAMSILSIVIGSLTIISGIFSLPLFGIDTDVFRTFKGILSLFAVILISIELYNMLSQR